MKSKFYQKAMIISSIFLLLTIVSCKANIETKIEKSTNNNSFYVASWNLENLFDTVDDSLKNDEEYTPDGKKEWTNERLETKFKQLAKVINKMNNNSGPDILAVQEVEHEKLLTILIQDYLINKNLKTAYAESPDKRGIDNGIIYNSELFTLNQIDTLVVKLETKKPTRYILQANFTIKESKEELNIFVVHMPSRWGGQKESEPLRITSANVLRNKINLMIAKNNLENTIILGDFNDDPENDPVEKFLGANRYVCSEKINPHTLYNLSYKLFKEGEGSYLYKGNWNMLDQIIVSSKLLDKNNYDYECDSFEVLKFDFIVNPNGKYKGSALRTFGGNKYLGGFSDHFPVGIKIIKR